MPTSRRLLVLCSPASGKVAGVQTIPATLDTAASGSSEDTSKGAGIIPGTADYKSIRQSMRVSSSAGDWAGPPLTPV